MAIKHVTQETFEQEVLNASGVVLVDFWAPWCGPCRMLAPVLEDVDKQLGETASIVKVNVDESDELSARYGIVSIPTLIAFRGGKAVGKLVGLQDRQDIEELIKI